MSRYHAKTLTSFLQGKSRHGSGHYYYYSWTSIKMVGYSTVLLDLSESGVSHQLDAKSTNIGFFKLSLFVFSSESLLKFFKGLFISYSDI